MDEKNKEYPLPFVTRKMLNFEYASKFQLEISSRSFEVNTINIVGATKEGVFKFTHTTTTISDIKVETFNLPDLPIWVSVTDPNNYIFRGKVYASVKLKINNDVMQELCGGFVYISHGLSWPSINSVPPEPIDGLLSIVQGANPAAGASANITVPAGQTWEVMGMNIDFVTAAAVANRVVHISTSIQGQNMHEFISSVTQTASLTRHYSMTPLGTHGVYTDNDQILIPIPQNMLLGPGDQVAVSATNIQGADDFGVLSLYVKKYISLEDL